MVDTVEEETMLLPSIGAPRSLSLPIIDRGDPVTVLSEKRDEQGIRWLELRSERSGADGWARNPQIIQVADPVFEEIASDADKTAFAQSCMDAARAVGTRAHFLLAWAQLASGLANKLDKAGAQQLIGPYRFSQTEWDANRISEASEVLVGRVAYTKRGVHPYVAAVLATAARDALMAPDDAAPASPTEATEPTARDLLVACLMGPRTARQVLHASNAGKQLEDVVASSLAPAADAGKLTDELLERHAGILANGKVADVLQAITDKFALALEATIPILKSLPDDEFPLTPADAGGDSNNPDEMVLLQYSDGTMVRGHVVARMQAALGIDKPDRLFGKNTRDALNAWLEQNGHDPNGRITVKQWKQLTGGEAPSLFDLCAQVTAAFEGHGFGDRVVGAFDTGLLTWGYLGFTWGAGHIQKILGRIEAKDANALTTAFGAERATFLRDLLGKSEAEQHAWARSIDLGPSDHKIQSDWDAGFKALGLMPLVQEVQLAYGNEQFWTPSDADRVKLGFTERLSSALCLDTKVQRGSIPTERVQQGFIDRNAKSELDRRIAFGETIVALTTKHKEDVRERKVDCLARGKGRVHDDEYDLVYWGLIPQAREVEDHLSAVEVELANKLGSGEVTIEKDDAFSDFYLKNVSKFGNGFVAREFLVKGGSHSASNPNDPPPREMWPNVINLARVLIAYRELLGAGRSITITSCYRSPKYNKRVGGKPNSLHKHFKAADIIVKGPGVGGPRKWGDQLRRIQKELKLPGGIGIYSGFTHVDVRGYYANW